MCEQCVEFKQISKPKLCKLISEPSNLTHHLTGMESDPGQRVGAPTFGAGSGSVFAEAPPRHQLN